MAFTKILFELLKLCRQTPDNTSGCRNKEQSFNDVPNRMILILMAVINLVTINAHRTWRRSDFNF